MQAAADGSQGFPFPAGSPYSELRERLGEYRSFVDLGLDFTAAKAIVSSAGNNGNQNELACKLASGTRFEQTQNKSANVGMDRGPCMAAGYAVYPRIPAADGQDEALSDLMAVLDSAGLCPFLCNGIGMDMVAELLSAATGQFSQQDVTHAAQRIGRSIRWTA